MLIYTSNLIRIDSMQFLARKMRLTRKNRSKKLKITQNWPKTRDFYRTVRKLKFIHKTESDMLVKLIEYTKGVYLAI